MINNRNQCPDGYIMSPNGNCQLMGRYQTRGGIGMTRRLLNQETQIPTIPNENPPGTREYMNCNDCIDNCIGNFMNCLGCDSYPKHGCSCTYMDWGWDAGWCCHGNMGDHNSCIDNCVGICMNQRIGGQGYSGERGMDTGRIGRKGGRIRRRR